MLAKFATGSSAAPTYVDDVFSAYTYTGNGSTQTITNGIDLAGKGGLVWTKVRSTTDDHELIDTVRGRAYSLESNTTDAQATSSTGTSLSQFNSNGYTLAANGNANVNENNQTFVSWTFRKAAKFFDVVTWTGSGGASKTINHSLGVTPGMIIYRVTNTTDNWWVWHRGTSANKYLWLDQPTPEYADGGNAFFSTAPTPTQFTVGSSGTSNGGTYVAYIFAHDTGTDGIIQCGSFTTDGSGNATVNLGWEPQFIIQKRIDSSSFGNWYIGDVARGMGSDASTVAQLYANTSGAEVTGADLPGMPRATGYLGRGVASATYIYLAIRRPNKPPTSGTQVYNAIARTGTGAAATVTGVGFAPDLVNVQKRTLTAQAFWQDRLRGAKQIIYPSATAAESTDSVNVTDFLMDGFALGAGSASNNSGDTYINHFFRRAPGVFDIVCYTGDGTTNRSLAHNLGVAPELVIQKIRTGTTGDWNVSAFLPGFTNSVTSGFLDSSGTLAQGSGDSFFYPVSASAITLRNGTTSCNYTNYTYVAYLFATKAGISKVGSYTGNGSSQTINCGFSAGARFVLIKRTDSTGDWYVWDTARGIVAGNDPHLSLNTTAAEVTTDDSIDPDSSGFIVNQLAATNINVTSATYVYLAFA